MVRKLFPIFSHSFTGKVWNIVSDRRGDQLLIETREESKFSTTFYIYDRVNNTLTIKDLAFEEKWWIGISYFNGPVVVFHTFPGSENPDQKEFFAYDLHQQEVLWNKTDINIIDFDDDSLLAYSEDGEVAQKYDLMTGEPITLGSTAARGKERHKFIKHPFHYAQGSDHFTTVAQFLSQHGFEGLERGIDYFEGNEVVIMAFYQGGTELVNDLLVMNMDQEVILQERLGSGLKGISDRAFFICHNTLIFVKNNTDFFSFQLPG